MELIVSDFDGTYLVSEDKLIENNKRIHEFRKNKNLFMLSSGRSYASLKEMTLKYNIEYDFLSCCDGSILYDNKGNIIKQFDLDNTILKKFLGLKKYSKIERIQYSYKDDYYDHFLNNSLIGCNLVIRNDEITNKFLKKFEDLKENNKTYDFLQYRHDEITFFCIKNKGINKSSTIKVLKDLYNLDYEDIYVFGDNENDYAMLSSFKGYYIGSVDDRIKNVCLKGYNQLYEFLDEKNLITLQNN